MTEAPTPSLYAAERDLAGSTYPIQGIMTPVEMEGPALKNSSEGRAH